MERHPDYLKYRKIFDQVVRDILEGKLEHDQTEYHCGTAHCVRGWFEVKAAKHFYNQDYNPVTEMFVDADGTSHIFSAVFDDFATIGRPPLEECSYLTGYDFQILAYMFAASNTLYEIRGWAEELGIDLSPTKTVPSNVQNNTPVVVKVPCIS